MVLARVFVVGCLLAAQTVSADFSGKVVGVSDGDTITVLKDQEQVKVRLVEIDAPEKGQAYGNRSKQTLSELVLGKQVEIRERGTDRYGRTLGHINQSGLDVNAEMVRRGMAWVYVKYARDRGLSQIEVEAREQRRGVWADKNPIPPWEWRRARKGG